MVERPKTVDVMQTVSQRAEGPRRQMQDFERWVRGCFLLNY